MTTLTEMYSLVRDEVNRGTTFDDLIKTKVRQALKWVERTHTFKHMERYVELTIDPTDTYPRTVSVPSGFKSMDFWRMDIAANDKRYLKKVDPKDVSTFDTDQYPTGYWMDGLEYFWLDNTPESSVACAMGYNKFTAFSTNEDLEVPAFTLLEDVVVAQTMVLFAPTLRMEAGLKQEYKNQRNEAMDSATLMDKEMRGNNTDDSMFYDGERIGS